MHYFLAVCVHTVHALCWESKVTGLNLKLPSLSLALPLAQSAVILGNFGSSYFGVDSVDTFWWCVSTARCAALLVCLLCFAHAVPPRPET